MPLKRLLSYFIPIREKTIKSEVNGSLQVTWEGGIKVLNTKNANYSYGTLHQVFQNVLEDSDVLTPFKEDLDGRDKRVLILGFGAGSVYRILREEKALNSPITGVDLDPSMSKVLPYFYPNGLKDCTIHYGDALSFLNSNSVVYDLIISDLFIDNVTWQGSLKPQFIKTIRKNLNPMGCYIQNTMFSSFEKERSHFILLEQVFTEVQMFSYFNTNSVFVCKNNMAQQ